MSAVSKRVIPESIAAAIRDRLSRRVRGRVNDPRPPHPSPSSETSPKLDNCLYCMSVSNPQARNPRSFVQAQYAPTKLLIPSLTKSRYKNISCNNWLAMGRRIFGYKYMGYRPSDTARLHAE